jgi:subtilisin-like proprotein convertase family protein
MKPFSFFGLADKLRGRQTKRKPLRRRPRPGQLLLEELETRTLLSVIPPVTATAPGVVSNPSFVGVNPVIAYDPTHPNKIFEANLIGGVDPNDPPTTIVTNLTLQVNYSDNGGAAFSSTTGPALRTDPLGTTISTFKVFDVTGGPSIAFDTLDNVYLVYTEHNQANTSGEVLLDKYNFSGTVPTVVFTGHVLYQWVNQDPAENAVVAIDTNQTSFTDPQATSEVQTDPLAATVTHTINSQPVTTPSAVYVAWNVIQTQPFSVPQPPPVNKILVEASDDGGMTFGTQEYVSAASSGASSGSDILQFLASYTVTPEGSPVGAAFGKFYNDPREASHDLVFVNDSAIVTSLVTRFGTVVQSADTLLPAGATPIAFAAGDFNGDGYTDVAVVLRQSGNYFLDIYTSNQDGTFTAGQSIQLSGTPDTIVSGKLNTKNNNFIDLAIGDVSTTGSGEVQIFLGSGSGTFTHNSATQDFPTSLDAASAIPVSIVVGQFNSNTNTYESLVVANQGSNDVAILTGNGDGSFNRPSAGGTVSGLSNPLQIAEGDFNNDGLPDIAILSNSTGTNGTGVIALGTGNGTFNLGALGSFGVTQGAVSLATGDFAGNGNESIVTADVTPAIGSKLSVDGGNGNGTFAAPLTFAPTAVSPFVALATTDLNGDGRTDLATVNGNATANNVIIYAGFSAGITGGEAEGAAPQILFTQGTPAVGNSNARIPGGELMFVWNGAYFFNTTEIFNSIDINLSRPTGSNPASPAPPVSDQLFFGVGGSIADAITVGNTKIPGVTDFTIPSVDISDTQFTTLADLSIALNLVEPNIGNVAIDLILPPALASQIGISEIPLVNSATTATGGSTGDGLPGVANLGLVNYVSGNSGEFIQPTGATQFDSATDSFVNNVGGTIFQANAERSITDKSDVSPYVGVFQPEGEGSLQALLNAQLTPAELDGAWKLEITNFTPAGPSNPPEHLIDWSLNFTSDVSTKGFGSSSTVVSTGLRPGLPITPGLVLGGPAGTYPQVTTDSGPLGIGPGIAVAIDNTLGAFSPYQGRMYLAYNEYTTQGSNDTTVVLAYSDNNGATWTNVGPVTDDSVSNGFSEGDRPKFNPSLTVDPVTGTVIITYYDGRYDPSDVRIANAMQTSIDGGQTWGTSTFLNDLNTATDFLSGDSKTIEPIPGNAPQSNVVGFGNQGASVLAYDGQVLTAFASNLNETGSEVFVSQGTFADGPRVMQGDEGPITQDSTTTTGLSITYNNTFAADGTRQLTGFVITFDRPVDALNFIANENTDVQILYRSPTTPASIPGTTIPVGSITPLDYANTNALPGIVVDNVMATSFLITLATPASMVGTYSYAIGPMVSDRVRSKTINGNTVLGTAMDQNADGTPGEANVDAFADPDPLNGIPFDLPYNTNTEPLIVPGPHVIFTYSPAATPPTASQVDAIEDGTIPQTANVVVDNSVSSMYIVFDRNMNPTTFNNAAAVLSFIGPNGAISGPFTITPDPVGTDPALAARTFLVTFPTQKVSGTYSLEFSPTAQDTHGDAVDTNLNAGLYVLDGSDPTNSTPTVSTYSNTTPVTIVPGQTVISQLSISDAYLIEQDATHHIQVQLNITYPNDPDLEASLIAPNGTVIPLFTNVGNFGAPPHANFENTIFDDFASTPIQEASVPFDIGPFNPQEPLSVLVGQGSEGVWRLAITDTATTNPGGTAQLTYWTLSLPHTTPGTGLGEAVADRFPVSFQIFTQSPTLAVSSTSYTAIGPADENGLEYDPSTGQYDIVNPNANSGQVNAIAVDPSDPSGNTVYVGGGTGGIWKTTDFLTTNPHGPTWYPLANFGPTDSLNISSLAVFPVNNNPDQSIIFAITGNSSQYGADGFNSNPSADQFTAGVGLLRSMDGGKTWEVLDGLNNVSSNGTILPIQSSARDHTFAGQVGFKVVVDPHLLPGGNVAVYAAFSGPNGGLYRSTNSGNTWTLVMAGNCTDITLAPASVDNNGNEETLYAAFQSSAFRGNGDTNGSGVFMTTSALSTNSLNLMAGGEGVNTRVEFDTAGFPVPIPVGNDSLSPNGKGGRIVLATPDLTASPLLNTFYQGWLYAAVVNANGTFAGLYLTKDFGNNWTLINLSTFDLDGTPFLSDAYGTNDTSEPSYDPAHHPDGGAQGNYDISLAIDPTNPDVVYLGGTANFAFEPAGGLIRIDTSKLLDVYAEVPYRNDAPDGGSTEFNTTGESADTLIPPPNGSLAGPSGILDPNTFELEENNGTTAYLNLFRNPESPFVNPSTTLYTDIQQFNNLGTGAVYAGFNDFADGSTNFHTLVTMIDPTTGTTRVILGDDNGVFSAVDDGTGATDAGDGFATAPDGSRNGNLSLAQLSAGTAQPSTLTADIVGALYYGIGPQAGPAQSDPNILTDGNLTWQAVLSSGQDIETDPTGSGTLYQFRYPNFINQFPPFLPTDFFLVTPVTPGQPPSIITSRTTGLLRSGDNPDQNLGEWPGGVGFNFAVNPVDPTAIVISSENGNIFRTSGPTTGTGRQWFLIGQGSALDGSNAQALAFGAPNPSLDDFIYAGTIDGHIYVTTNGGGSWTNISAGLDGSAVQQIVTDPRAGSHDAYAVTLHGVYFMADSTATGARWVKLDDTAGEGNLFSLTRANYGNASDPITTLTYLSSIVADWRYAIPDNPSNPSGPTHPVLYVAGDGGVFRSLDQGQTWTFYPDVTLDSAITEGGLLPNAPVTDLTLELGDINPSTGFPNTSSGLNQLVVTTYGRGEYAIRLDPNAVVDGHPLSYYLDQPKPAAAVASISEIVPIPGTALTGIQVTFAGPIDPTTFTTAEIDSLTGPNGAQVQVASIVNASPTPPAGQGNPDNIYDLIFATPQTATGNYTLTIGPNITDDSGDPMAAAFTGVLFFTPDTAPTITPNPLADQVVAPGGTDVVHFTVGSTQYASQLTVTAGSANTPLLPNSDLTLTNTGDNYTLTITPPAGTNTGQSMVTITVTDPQTLSTQSSFNVIVDVAPTLPPVNGNDTITLPHNQFPYSGALGATAFGAQTLTYTATATGDSQLYDLQHQYQFTGAGYFTAGAAAYVLHSNLPGTGFLGYYLLRPSDGALFAYDGSGSYSHTFANGTPIATLGASVYTDPTILLNAQPPVDYTTLYNLQQQYQFTGLGYFTAGATAYVLHSNQSGPGFMGYYLLRADGSLFAYDGSGSYSHTFANGTPIATLAPTVYTHPGELTNAEAAPTLYAQLYQLTQKYDLEEIGGSFYTNTDGHQAKWVYSPILNQFGQHWYTLTLNTGGTQAILTAWEGYADSEVGTVVATLDPSVYANPTLLTNATALPDPAVTATVSNTGTLMIGLPSSDYIGTFKVTVTASDGLLSSSQTVTVTSTDTAPVVTVANGMTPIPQGGSQSSAHLSFPVTDSVTVTDAENDTTTTTASVASYSLPFALQQQYQFKGLGYFTAGATAYVLQAVSSNSFGNPYYLLNSSGGLYAYDGSGSYAHTFANVTPLANLGADTYIDPTLLLNAQAPTNYTNLYNTQQQYQFTGLGYFTNSGVTAYVLHSNQAGAGVSGYYLLTPNGSLYAYDGSGNYATDTSNSANLIATFEPAVYVSPTLLTGARATPGLYPQLYQDEQQFDLEELGGSFYTGLRGTSAASDAAKWLYSPILNSANTNWYTLVLSATGTQALLYAWDGGSSAVPNGASPVAVLDPTVYADPTLLTNAKSPTATSNATAGVAGSVLTINSPANFVGSFQVSVNSSDGILTTTQTFVVQSTDTAPVPTTIPPQTASKSGSPLQVTLSSTDAENDPVTYTAAAVGYSPAFNLQQIYNFTPIGYVTNNGVTAYVLQSTVLGGVGGYYLLKSDGGVYAYDGSGSYAHTFANNANLITTLSPSVYTTPTLLTNAQAPATPAAVVGVSGNTLTVNVANVAVGTVFEVYVTASDGAETTRTGFLVTVTA